MPIIGCLPAPWRWPCCLGLGEVGEGAIKWRRGRSEAQSFALASARRLPEVKSGRDTPSVLVGWAGVGGARCFSRGLRTLYAPLRAREALALVGEGLVLAPEVVAGECPCPPPPLASRRSGNAPHPAEEKGARTVFERPGVPSAIPAQGGEGGGRCHSPQPASGRVLLGRSWIAGFPRRRPAARERITHCRESGPGSAEVLTVSLRRGVPLPGQRRGLRRHGGRGGEEARASPTFRGRREFSSLSGGKCKDSARGRRRLAADKFLKAIRGRSSSILAKDLGHTSSR